MTEPKENRVEGENPRWRKARLAMVCEIVDEVRETESFTGEGCLDERIRGALETVPRHAFVPPAEADLAYINHPLPIGAGQTISQPYIVAIMTQLLAPEPDHVVLEVGTGSGYQTAILAMLVRRVFSIEVVPELAQTAAERLHCLGYANVEVRTGDGGLGWPEHAPFDRIIVTAAAPKIPPPLIEQLKPGGRMVVPVGKSSLDQSLVLVTKDLDGKISERDRLPVAFVPLVGRHADKRRWL